MRFTLYKFVLICFIFLSTDKIYSQEANQITFKFLYKNTDVIIDENYTHHTEKEIISIKKMKFYISNILLYTPNGRIDTLDKSVFLIDASQPESAKIKSSHLKFKNYDHISFDIGIDSITHLSGAFGGDLDPMHGMYWTWQNGYINLKLEGKSNLCNSKTNKFTLHIGGYQHPFNMIQRVSIDLNDSLVISVLMDELIKQMHTIEDCEIMSPNKNALLFSECFNNVFRSIK